MKLFGLICAFLCSAGQISNYEGPIANTRLGKIQGSQMISSAGRNFLAFRGIPYAKPPTGHRRFKDPEPVDSWETIFNATTEGPTCVQYNIMVQGVIGVEDCLVLNVYTHNLDSHNLRPVMVWIHGGGFALGSGNGETDIYGPKFLLDRDIVLVTINYRLGPFGFFTTEDEEAPGNYGLLDQTLALRWVQDHIDRFGGDPKSVTIFGESAGGGCVHFHMLSPRSKGLFHGVIAQSGAANCMWAISGNVGEYSTMLAKHLKCPTSSKDMVECLQQRTPEEILLFVLSIQNPAGYPIAFQPRLDVERSSPFIDRLPKEILESGQFNQVPFIVGMNQNEGSSSVAMYSAFEGKILKSIEEDLDGFVLHLLGLEFSQSGRRKAQQVVQRYLKTDKSLREQITELEQLISDSMFFKCINDNVQLNAKYNPEPTYFYWYTHKGNLTFPLVLGAPSDIDFGVSHADELFLLFSLQSKLLTTGEDLKVSKILLDLWTSFAARGKPSSDLSETWLPSTEQEPRYLNINSNPELVHGQFPFKDRIAFWDQIGHDQVSVKTEL